MNEMMITTNTANIPTFANKALQNATTKVLKIGDTVRRCAYETAYIMAQVDASECYKDDGFNSVHDWAMKTFGFKKSASYTLLRVGKEYTQTILDAKGRIKGYTSNLWGDEIDPETGDFTTTQIEKMLPGGHDLAVELVENGEITPDMTCKDIEKVIKYHTNPPEEDTEDETSEETEDSTGETSEEPETVIVAIIDEDGNVTEPRYKIPVEVLALYRI